VREDVREDMREDMLEDMRRTGLAATGTGMKFTDSLIAHHAWQNWKFFVFSGRNRRWLLQ
jgi:hypothetical protein